MINDVIYKTESVAVWLRWYLNAHTYLQTISNLFSSSISRINECTYMSSLLINGPTTLKRKGHKPENHYRPHKSYPY